MKLLDRSLPLKSLLFLTMLAGTTFLHAVHNMYQSIQEVSQVASTTTTPNVEAPDRCAINLFGLPRAFRSLTLPSLIKNVIELNADCDYFVHYYHVTNEAPGRLGQGGTIDPYEILLLKNAVLQAAVARNKSRAPIVDFTSDTDK
jgi:hypothetical protein